MGDREVAVVDERLRILQRQGKHGTRMIGHLNEDGKSGVDGKDEKCGLSGALCLGEFQSGTLRTSEVSSQISCENFLAA